MKKFLIVLLCIIAVAGVGCSVYLGMQYSQVSKEKEVIVQQNAVLQSNIDAIGPVTVAYTVASEVSKGDVIHTEDFVEITVPASSITEDTVIDLGSIDGLLYKVDICPGTTMTNSLVMDNAFAETVYEQDMTFNFLPLGLEVGDYVDVEIVFPFGETFTVIPHKRIEQVVLSANTVKVRATAAQQILWESAQKDKDLYGGKGLVLRLSKYVEPGVNDDVVGFYPVRSEMEAVVNLNPNIKDAKQCVNSRLRRQIDALLDAVTDEDGQKLQAGANSESSGINQAASAYVENKDNGSSNDSFDLNDSFEAEVTEGLEEIDGTLTDISKVDASGNSSSITQSQKDDSRGESLFGDETTID